MTQDEIIEMARQAKAIPMHKDFNQLALIGTENIEDFAKLVAEKEREACAKIADEWAVGWPHPSQVIAERIRGQA
jgi:L-ascorbate metabolism protein UlaG (beta-lactamase superfamily)